MIIYSHKMERKHKIDDYSMIKIFVYIYTLIHEVVTYFQILKLNHTLHIYNIFRMSLFFYAFLCHLLEKHLDRFSQNKKLTSMPRQPSLFSKILAGLSDCNGTQSLKLPISRLFRARRSLT